MNGNVCPQCGAPIDPGAMECRYCGERLAQQQVNRQMNQQYNQQPPQYQYGQPPMQTQQYGQPPIQAQQYGQQTVQYGQQYGQPPMQYGQPPVQQGQTVYVQQSVTQNVYSSPINPAWPLKSKVTAGILALFLGGLGIHKFYLGKTGMGILYLVFCWTYIPGIIAFIEGISYLCSSDERFQLKHHVRLK